MNIGLVILAVYIAVLLGIALYASKKDKKNIKDFATGGGLGIFILTLTFSATYHSAYAFMGASGFAYKNGIGWWCNGLSYVPVCQLSKGIYLFKQKFHFLIRLLKAIRRITDQDSFKGTGLK